MMAAEAPGIAVRTSLRHPGVDLAPRHIQNFSDAKYLEPHWGYDDRAMPCTKDEGACKYLDAVYHGHDVGILYIGVIWATLFGILFLWAIGRRFARSSSKPVVLGSAAAFTPELQALTKAPRPDTEKSTSSFAALRNKRQAGILQAFRGLTSGARRQLLPDAAPNLFGRTTRLQVLVLALLVGYLTIFSFAGLVYGKWISPVAGGKHSTRTTLGPWADRIGVLAFGLTPLSILLSSRESILSLVTGLPYTKFNFLHRWLGYVIVVQSVLHTISWTIIEARLYQPQPTTGRAWITELYMRWGLVAIAVLMLLFVFSLPCVIRRTGYEFFRKTHYVLAMVYIGACWGHWSKLKIFLLPSLLIWLIDRSLRLLRSFLLHYSFISTENSGVAFRPAQSSLQIFPDAQFGDIIRLDFDHQQKPWSIGQHFYLCFSELSIWQSHPFTPLSYPKVDALGRVRHSYLFRAKAGETKKLATLAAAKLQNAVGQPTTGVILAGPYGQSNAVLLEHDLSMNVVCIAGGTGITYVLPLLKHAALLRQGFPAADSARIELIWIVKQASDAVWVWRELAELEENSQVTVRIITTREEKEETLIKSRRAIDSNESTPSTEKGCYVAAELSSSNVCQCRHDGTLESGHTCQKSDSGRVDGTTLRTRRGSQSGKGRPDVATLLQEALHETATGPTTVFASGPGSMLSDVRHAVALRNAGMATWNGIERADIRVVCDDRMDWF